MRFIPLMPPRPRGKTPHPPYYYWAYIAGGLAFCLWPFFAYHENVKGRDDVSVRQEPWWLILSFCAGVAIVVLASVQWWVDGKRARAERERSDPRP